MEAIQLTRAIVGVSYTEKGGNLFHSRPTFSIFRESFFGVALKKQRLRKQRAITSKRSIQSTIIEKKDFEFKPAFDDYLKVMESVKATRVAKKIKENEEDRVKLESLALSEEIIENREGMNVKSGKVERPKRVILDGENMAGKGFNVVTEERITYGGARVMRNSKRTGEVEGAKRVILDGERMLRKGFNAVSEEKIGYGGAKVMGNAMRTEKVEGSKGNIHGGELNVSERFVLESRIGYGSAIVLGNAKRTGKVEGPKGNIHGGEFNVSERFVLENRIGYGSAKVLGNANRTGKVEGPKTNILDDKSGVRERFNIVAENKIGYGGTKVNESTTRRKGVNVYSDDVDDDNMDRAAFRSLNENGDPYDMPRVTRADMEERIQKLAKCLNGADIDMPEWMFSKMMRSAQIKFSDHTILRIIQILGNLGNWKRVLQVIDWIQSGERFKSHKIRYVYTAALDALKRVRRPAEALNLFHAMQQRMASYPDRVAYHCMAVILGQAGYMKELFDVIDAMRSPPKKKFKLGIVGKWDPRIEPDDVVYNSVLNACVVRKNWEGAFWVLQQLNQQGLKPSTSTYGLVMEVMYTSGKYNLVHDFFKKVQKSGIPNALTYKVLVNTLSREGKVEAAVLAVKHMERQGIVGTASLYYDLARGLCSAGRFEEALKQIDKICRVASKPLVVTYTGLIQACVECGDIKGASYIFSQMHNFCSPNLVTYNIMLKAYLDHGMFEEGKQMFLSLLRNVNGIKNNSDYRHIVLPDIYTFNTILEACAEKQRWDDFEQYYFQMLRSGFHYNSKRHLSLVLGASNAGKGEVLEATWKHIIHSDRARHPVLVREMFWKKLEQGAYATAVSCIAKHAHLESPIFSAKSWKNFFTERGHELQTGAFDAALVHMQEEVNISASSDAPNRAIKNLVTSCREYLRINMKSSVECKQITEGIQRTLHLEIA